MNEFVKIARRCLIFLIFLYSTDILLGNMIQGLFFKQKSGSDYNLNYLLEKSRDNLIIFGSSSANHHYNSSILEDSLKVSVFNAGRDGVDILFNFAIFNSLIKRHIPKVIIFNLSPNELSTELKYDRLSGLLPYYEKYPEMKKVIYLKSDFEKIKLFSKIYPYNSTLLGIFNGISKVTGVKTDIKGFIPIYGNIDTLNCIEKSFQEFQQIDQNRVNALIEISETCKEKGILLILIVSPVFNINSNETPSIKIIKSISESKNILFYNFINDKRFNKKTIYFKDIGHMNYYGANTFTNIVLKQINNDILLFKKNDLWEK